MSTKRMFVLLGTLVIAAVLITACGTPGPKGDQGPAGPTGPQGEPGPVAQATDLSCTECHNDTALIDGKKWAWQVSKHGLGGGAWEEEGDRTACAPCHSGAAFIDRMAVGKNFVDYPATEGLVLPDKTPQTCRTCHMIHTKYTEEDFALRTIDPVAMVISGATFDGGEGNLCVNCHQARRYMANFVAKDKDGNVIPDTYAANVRFNTHLSDQSDIMLGVLDVNNVLGVEGKPSAHYVKVEDTCVGCHLGGNRNHRFEPQVATCVECHSDAKDLNINGYETAFEEKFQELHDALVAKGILDAETGAIITKKADGSAITYDPKTAAALFVYGALEEDASKGAHNPKYADALLDAAIAALGK